MKVQKTEEQDVHPDGADETPSDRAIWDSLDVGGESDDGQSTAGEDQAGPEETAPDQTEPPEERAENVASEEGKPSTDARKKEPEFTEEGFRRLSGTISGLQRALDKERRENEALKKSMAASKPAGKEQDPDKEYQSAREAYPELFDAMDKRLAAYEERLARFDSVASTISSDQSARDQWEVEQALADELTRIHPDRHEIVRTEAFQAYFAKAPEYLRLAVAGKDLHATSDLLTRYKESMTSNNPLAARRALQKKGARTIPDRVSRQPELSGQDDRTIWDQIPV
ncbi:MAG: hypothetical protein HQL56_06875 [Magnetococcales bacterium]|nr:hypothetical protein [Magnetococcales bacterium]